LLLFLSFFVFFVIATIYIKIRSFSRAIVK